MCLGEQRATLIANAMPNQGVQPTAYSVRSCVASASSGG